MFQYTIIFIGTIIRPYVITFSAVLFVFIALGYIIPQLAIASMEDFNTGPSLQDVEDRKDKSRGSTRLDRIMKRRELKAASAPTTPAPPTDADLEKSIDEELNIQASPLRRFSGAAVMQIRRQYARASLTIRHGDGPPPSPPNTPVFSTQPPMTPSTQPQRPPLDTHRSGVQFAEGTKSEGNSPSFATKLQPSFSPSPKAPIRRSPRLPEPAARTSENEQPSQNDHTPENISSKSNYMNREGSFMRRSGSALSQLLSLPTPLEGDSARKNTSVGSSVKGLNKRFRQNFKTTMFGSPRRRVATSPAQVAIS